MHGFVSSGVLAIWERKAEEAAHGGLATSKQAGY